MMVPLAAAVLWMGVYPETFLAPMRKDIAGLEARLAQARPKGDAELRLGALPPAASEHEHGAEMEHGAGAAHAPEAAHGEAH
jgi:NADH-quinone oxidoreductase subunit M